MDELAELRKHAEAQAALFNVGTDEPDPVEDFTSAKETGIET